MAIEEPSYGCPLVTILSVSLNDEVVFLCRQLITPSGLAGLLGLAENRFAYHQLVLSTVPLHQFPQHLILLGPLTRSKYL
nr:hypothetical protein CFP56_39044 [Quercus suber]